MTSRHTTTADCGPRPEGRLLWGPCDHRSICARRPVGARAHKTMDLPGGIDQDAPIDDLHGACRAQRCDTKQHVGLTAGATAAASRSELAGVVAVPQPAGSSMTPGRNSPWRSGHANCPAVSTCSVRSMSSATSNTSALSHLGPPTLLTRRPGHDRPSELIDTPGGALHPKRPPITQRLKPRPAALAHSPRSGGDLPRGQLPGVGYPQLSRASEGGEQGE